MLHALMLSLALSLPHLPSPPTECTRDDVETRWGLPTMAGPLDSPWPAGSVLASYVQPVTDTDGICRVHLASKKGAKWIALVYYAPDGRMVSAHCLELGDLEVGHDVTPDVQRRLKARRT